MKKTINWILLGGITLLLTACARTPTSRHSYKPPCNSSSSDEKCRYGNPESYCVDGQTYYVMKSAKGYCKTGLASWYGTKFHGKKTSSREPYDMFALTAASRNLPIPTYVEVTNLENGKKIIVKVNDRGPFKSDRIIDLSFGAASKLGFANSGTANVQVRALDSSEANQPAVSSEILAANNSIPEVEINPVALPTPDEAPKAVTLERYLQFGAFVNRDNAVRLQKEVMEYTDAPVLIKQASVNGKNIYRVQIGPFVDTQQSEEISKQLRQHNFAVITIFS